MCLIDNEVYEYQKSIYLFDNIQYLKVKNSHDRMEYIASIHLMFPKNQYH